MGWELSFGFHMSQMFSTGLDATRCANSVSLMDHVVSSAYYGSIAVHVSVIFVGLGGREANIFGDYIGVESVVESGIHQELQVGAPLDWVPEQAAQSVDVGEHCELPVRLFHLAIAHIVHCKSSSAREAHEETAWFH